MCNGKYYSNKSANRNDKGQRDAKRKEHGEIWEELGDDKKNIVALNAISQAARRKFTQAAFLCTKIV